MWLLYILARQCYHPLHQHYMTVLSYAVWVKDYNKEIWKPYLGTIIGKITIIVGNIHQQCPKTFVVFRAPVYFK